MNVKELIEYGKTTLKENEVEDYNIIAKRLAKHVLKMNESDLVVNSQEEVDEEKEEYYKLELIEIVNGKPIQYITNQQEFYGQEFYVDENVLIPQPDTEILVEEVINISKQIENSSQSLNILDICTGSGCIGISLANNIASSKITLSDISKDALEVATKNANKLIGNLSNIKLLESDMFEEIEEEFDIIVSNPPYISFEELQDLDEQVKDEPVIALFGYEDGLGFYRILIEESHKYLSDDGYLCMEIGYNQKQAVIDLLKENGNYKNIYSKKDLSGNDRIVIAQRRK